MADIDWNAQPLGEKVDREIAQSLGLAVSTVWKARNKLGIPACKKPTVWDDEPLGEYSDATLGLMLGCSRQAVHQQRTKRGISAFNSK